MNGDLHCHTRLSNGSLSIEELIALAQSKKVETIAITDHECLAGPVRAKLIGDRCGIKVIPGVELSALDDDGQEVHILCYLAEFPDRLQGLCSENAVARRKAAQYMQLKVKMRYPSVTEELIKRCASGATNIYAQHFMHALFELGETDSLYGDVYKSLFDPSNENNILVTPKFSSVETVINAIHNAEGIAVLAHPAKYGGLERAERYVQFGLDGIEVWHPSASEELSAKLFDFCKKNGLLSTGGSGFHGLYNNGIHSLGSVTTPEAQLKELLSYKAKQKRLLKKKLAEEEK